MINTISSNRMRRFFQQQKELGLPDYIFSKDYLQKKTVEENSSEKNIIQDAISVETEKGPTIPKIVDEKEIYEAKRKALVELYYEIKNCRGCKLCATRNRLVFGAGNASAKIMIVGEGPGQEEDISGLPFVGKAGKLLDKMVGAINLDRKEDLFIANVVKCRPPGNRNPEINEISACMPILKRQIYIIKPKVILVFGKVAIKELLGREASISSLRLENGNHYYNKIPLILTYHPAALLRNEKYKRPAWEDLQKLQNLMKEMKINGNATSSKQ